MLGIEADWKSNKNLEWKCTQKIPILFLNKVRVHDLPEIFNNKLSSLDKTHLLAVTLLLYDNVHICCSLTIVQKNSFIKNK